MSQVQSAPSTASAHSLSTTNNILVNFLQTLPPGVDISQTLGRLKADLFSAESHPAQPSVQPVIDEGASAPVVERVVKIDDELDAYSGATLPVDELEQRETREEVDQQVKGKGQADLPLVEEGVVETGSQTQEIEIGKQDTVSGKGIMPSVEDMNVETELPSLREEIEKPITEVGQGARPLEMEVDPPVQREEEINEDVEQPIVEREPVVEEAPVSETELEIERTPMIENENMVVLDDDEDEDSVQMPEERVQPTEADQRQRAVEWIPVTALESKAENEEEDVPLQPRQRNRRLEFADEDGASGNMDAWETAPRTSELATPAGGVASQTSEPAVRAHTTPREVEEMEEEFDEERVRRERKRKGKDIATPAPKRSRPANRAVVIREPTPAAETVAQAGGADDSEEENLRWERRTKHNQDRRQGPVPTYSKIPIKMDNNLLKQMVKFPDQKWQEECGKRVTGPKKLKSGKKLHLRYLQELDVEAEFTEYITGIGFEWLLEMNSPKVPEELAKEFFTSF